MWQGRCGKAAAGAGRCRTGRGTGLAAAARLGLRRSGYAGRRPAMRCSGNAVLRSMRSSLVQIF
jgi:hypothetical protein